MRFLLLSVPLLISSCSLVSVYRIDIPQGTPLTQSQAAKVKVGMSKNQVTYLLGSPAVTDTLSPLTWNYLYDYTPGTYGKRDKIAATHQKQKLTITFDYADRVAQIEGLPSIPEKQQGVGTVPSK